MLVLREQLQMANKFEHYSLSIVKSKFPVCGRVPLFSKHKDWFTFPLFSLDIIWLGPAPTLISRCPVILIFVFRWVLHEASWIS